MVAVCTARHFTFAPFVLGLLRICVTVTTKGHERSGQKAA